MHTNTKCDASVPRRTEITLRGSSVHHELKRYCANVKITPYAQIELIHMKQMMQIRPQTRKNPSLKRYCTNVKLNLSSPSFQKKETTANIILISRETISIRPTGPGSRSRLKMHSYPHKGVFWMHFFILPHLATPATIIHQQHHTLQNDKFHSDWTCDSRNTIARNL